MIRDGNEGDFSEVKVESQENLGGDSFEACDVASSLDVSISQKGLLSSDDESGIKKQGMLRVIPDRLKILKFNRDVRLPSPSSKFREIQGGKDEISRSMPSSVVQEGFRARFRGILAWKSLWIAFKNWIKNPFNMALLLWIICVVISGAILFLVMTGMLDDILPDKSQRDTWFEVNNQILNALFTLMCLYQHPNRFYHLVLLCRWRPKDITKLQKSYCKNGTYKPCERGHMVVVVMLLHMNCFAQYALCSLNLGYKRSERPAIGVGICLSVAIVAPAIAGVYSIVSPLGKEYNSEFDEEAQDHILSNGTNHTNLRVSSEKRFSFASRNGQKIEYAPTWNGGLLDMGNNIALSYLSIFCTFCVFGWNMERLGFGNAYVHIATFLLFCTAPFWIFNLAAINIDNETAREALGITGIVLCLFGLLYGGFWRIQMRKRFNLPANNICHNKPALADCTLWLLCCWCALAQEVRTAEFYDVVEDRFCRKQTDETNNLSSRALTLTLLPLPREDGVLQLEINSFAPFSNSTTLIDSARELDQEVTTNHSCNVMKPPIISLMQRKGITN